MSTRLEQTGRQLSGALVSTKKDDKGTKTEHQRASLPKNQKEAWPIPATTMSMLCYEGESSGVLQGFLPGNGLAQKSRGNSRSITLTLQTGLQLIGMAQHFQKHQSGA